jgi:aspartate/methionine/tyrosine aminotransferase
VVRARAPYMEWAKSRPRPRLDLAGSNLLACSLQDLPGAREAVELSGESPDGYPPLLEAIASRYGVEPERVSTAPGCSGANFLACAALLEAGDDVVIERPTYDPLVAAVQMLGGRPRFFDRRFERSFALDPEAIGKAVRPETRLLIVSNPHNPSGVLATDAEIAALAGIAEQSGVPVLIDEVYQDAVMDRRPRPAATVSPLFVTSNSLTKAYGLSALRCGWTLASREITGRIRRARDVVDVSGPTPAERLALVAFRHLDRLAERARGLIEPNRRLWSEFLAGAPSLEAAPSPATLAFPRFRDGRDAAGFVRRLFEAHGVAVVPGSFFGLSSHFRVSLGGSSTALAEALAAMGRSLQEA